MMNTLAGYATALVMAIFTMASVLVFTGCDTGNEDDLNYSVGCNDCDDPNPNPDPEVTVKEVDHYGCELLSFEWSYKNAAETRAEYSVELADGGTFCNSAFRYLADIVYTDGTTQKANEEYNNRSSFVGFGYKNTLYVAAGEAATFENAPEITSQNTSNGVVTFLGWEKKTIAVLANTVNDVKSLSIGGKTMTDLCLPEVEFAYTNSTLERTGEDANYNSYNLTIYGDATVDYDGKAETKNFYFTLPIKEAKGGSVTPPVEDDKEIVDYEITNEKVDDNGNYSGDIEVIYSDGSSEIEGTITFSYIYSFEAEGNKTVSVSELSYTKKSASYGKNIRTGENRNFEQLGCTINLIGMKNTVSMVTNRGSRMFSGYWEYPIITMPNGKEIELLHNVAEMTEGSISDNGISGNQLVINMTASGKYGSNSKNLTSSITLVKVNDGGNEGGDEDFQTGAYAKDQRIEGSVIKWTLVRTFNKKADTETSMSIAHGYAMSLDSRKSTENRVYNAGTPALNETSKMSSSEGNYSFDFCKYTSTWSYSDFSHTANAEGRRNIVYHDGNFDVEVWDAALSIERNGVTLGTSNISSSSDKETYIDNINYILFAGNASVSNGSQEVEYSKSIEQKPEEDVVTYNVQKVKVENGKLYYNEIEMHSINTELNKTVEKSINLVFSLTAIATNDWTAKAGSTGIALTSYAQNYTTAKDYIFGSNRGNNTAKANLQTEYTVTYMGNTYTLSVSGTVNASVNLTSSTSTANTYTFTAKLYADGVEIAKDSDTAIETIEEEEKPEEDVVTYNVQKVKVENGKLYYNEIEMHSINTELNKTVEKSINLVFSLTAIATNDWTAKAGSTGIALTSYAQNYTTAKDYIFGSNRGNNTAKANLQTEYTVTYMGNTYTLSVSGTVNASVNLTSSTSTANTYTFTAKLYADGVEIAKDSDTAIETIEEEEKPEEDVVTYNVEKVGVRGNKLYYNEIESHSVNTELNKSVEKSVNLVYSFGVTACNDWTVMEGEATGLTLNASSFNYTSAKNYVFGSNRGDNIATANLQTSYSVSYMGNTYTLTIAGTVTGMVNMAASTATSNTYTFTGKLYADGVEIASDSDTAVETIEKEEEPDEPENPEKDYIEATSFDCTVSVTDSGLSGIVIIAHYADGTHVASNGATSTTWGNTLVNGQIGTLETVNHTYSWNKGYAAVPMQAFVYNGYDSPYIGCTPKDNGDGTYTVTSNRGGVSYTFPKRAK